MRSTHRKGIVWLSLISISLIWSLQTALAETRVLFVGNSVTYYHGLPYVFKEVASDLYGLETQVDTWAQAGGVLDQAASQTDVLAELQSDPYDVVVVQEWGSLLFCANGDEDGWSQRCKNSLAAHRRIISAAANDDATTVLLGTYQMTPEAAAALDEGERLMQSVAEIDAHVPFATIFLEARGRYPDMPWLDSDGAHPGSASVLLAACQIADNVFESERRPLRNLEFFEPPRSPGPPSLSYQSLAGTDVFLTETESALNATQIGNVFEICDE